jgi:hypothetical protein
MHDQIITAFRDLIKDKDVFLSTNITYEESFHWLEYIFKNLEILNNFKSSSLNFEGRDKRTDLALNIIANMIEAGLCEQSVPLDLKIKVIKLSRKLFSEWMVKHPENAMSGFMFWDSVCCQDEVVKSWDRSVKDEVFNSLIDILKIDNYTCQLSALHGFNHLKDDRCQLVIDNFLKENKDKELATAAEAYRTYTVM